jgi:hypothetical protein
MKKSLLIALFGAASVAAYGQGQINFANYYSSHQVTGVSYGNGPNQGLGAGPEISVELLYGASTDTAISQLTALAVSITALGMNGASGPDAFSNQGGYTGTGVFNVGNVTVPTIGVTGPGSVYAFALYAFGTSAGGVGGNGIYKGWSSIFTGPTQGSGIPLPTVPNLPDGLVSGSFSVSEVITPVPEPSSLALAGLGGFGMLMAFRRKKA